MNLSGLLDTLQLFLTEYNYVSFIHGTLPLTYLIKFLYKNYNFRNRWERWEASTSGGGATFVLLGKVKHFLLFYTFLKLPLSFQPFLLNVIVIYSMRYLLSSFL